MKVALPKRNPAWALLLVICAFNLCSGQQLDKKSVLALNKDWIDPSDRFNQESPPEHSKDGSGKEITQDGEVPIERHAATELAAPGNGNNGQPAAFCERSLSECQSQLLRHQMMADVTNNGALTADMVYLRRWVKAIMRRLDSGFLTQKDTPARLEMSFSSDDLAELRTSLDKLDVKAANRISSKLNDLVASAEVSFDYKQKPSKLQLLWLNICDIVSEVNILFIIRTSMVILAIVFIVVLVKSRSRVFTFSYGLIFIFWMSFFWYWQNLIRRSEADRYHRYTQNPCEKTRSWYNVMGLFHSDSKECQEFLRQQFTPAHMEYSPIEVLLHMISEYSSKAISVGVVNLLGGLGRAVREFADQQSWFSVVPAFFLVFAVTLTLAFKTLGMAISIFGIRLEASGGEARRAEPIAPPLRRRHRDADDQLITNETEHFVERRRADPLYIVDSRGTPVTAYPPYGLRLIGSIPSPPIGSAEFVEMPPPATTSVPRRLTNKSDQVNRDRKPQIAKTSGDGAFVSENDDDDDYDTANDDNDL